MNCLVGLKYSAENHQRLLDAKGTHAMQHIISNHITIMVIQFQSLFDFNQFRVSMLGLHETTVIVFQPRSHNMIHIIKCNARIE